MTPETYVTPDQVAAAWPAFAKIPTAEQTDLIAAASAAIQARVRRTLGMQTHVEVHSGRNRPRIWLRVRPVVAVSQVTVDGDPLDDSQGTAWTFVAETGELVRGDGLGDSRFAPWFPAGVGNVVVTYAAGYDPIPADVRRATILTVQALHAASALSGAYKSESIGDYSYTLNDGLVDAVPPVAARLVSRYVQDEVW